MNLLSENFNIKGIAHITGGGLSNLNRILPKGLDVKWDDIPRPDIFDIIQKSGEIEDEEMKNVFNNGIGMCLVVDKEEKKKINLKQYGIIEVGQII